MNEDMLSDLLKQYENPSKMDVSYPIFDIDTSNGGKPIETAYSIADDILKIFEERTST